MRFCPCRWSSTDSVGVSRRVGVMCMTASLLYLALLAVAWTSHFVGPAPDAVLFIYCASLVTPCETLFI